MYCYCGNDPIDFVDPYGHNWSSFINFLATSADILITVAAIAGGAVIGLLAGGGVAGAAVVSVSTTIVVNTLVNVVYYNCVLADPNNDIMLHEEAQKNINRNDQKSYYVDNGYINRWDRLKFIRSKNQGDSFYSGSWHDYSEYTVHMYAWLFSGWAHNTNIPVVSDVASSSVFNDFGMNTPLIELWIYLLGFLGI